MLGRLRIRGKLALIVALPLLAVGLLAVPNILGAIDQAQRAEKIEQSMHVANRVTSLTSELRQERLLSLGYLLGVVDRTKLTTQTTRVSDRIVEIRGDAARQRFGGAGLSESVTAAVGAAEGLAELRAAVLAREADPVQLLTDFNEVVGQLIESLRLVNDLDLATPAAQQVAALDAALRGNESLSQTTDLLLLAVVTGAPEAMVQYAGSLRLVETHLARITEYASAEQIALVELMTEAYTVRDATGVGEPFATDLTTIAAQQSPLTVFQSLESLGQLGRFIEKKVITDVLLEVEAAGQTALRTAYLVGLGSLLVVALVVALTTALARTVVRPLRGLTSSAHRVARVAETELARIADDESDSAGTVRLEPIRVQSQDEIGDLGRAFDRVQATAVRLVDRQTAIRRNVALMFGYLGRRTHNLVGRQLALIDQLERAETEPDKLAELYQLDHIASRLRRSASSLVVLSGSSSADEHIAPVPLSDLVRLALGEIEDYQRVDVEVPASIRVAPAVIGDLVLVLAELMENATTFSPPHTRVMVTARSTSAGVELIIVDHGIGMSPHRLAEENARLARRERLDLAPTEVLGLFVVGRLARRHGLRVTLAATPGGGLTASLWLEPALLVTGDRLATRKAPAQVRGQPERSYGQPSAALAPVAVARLAPELVDLAALGRASRTLAAVQPWNAFALVARPPQTEPPQTEPAQTEPTPAEPTPAEPTQTGAARTDRTGNLRRRVPGATLRALGAPGSVPVSRRSAMAAAEPERVRELVEQLESGVARALSEIRPAGQHGEEA